MNALETWFTYIFHVYFCANIFHKFQNHENHLTTLIITWIRVKDHYICQLKESEASIQNAKNWKLWSRSRIKLHNKLKHPLESQRRSLSGGLKHARILGAQFYVRGDLPSSSRMRIWYLVYISLSLSLNNSWTVPWRRAPS